MVGNGFFIIGPKIGIFGQGVTLKVVCRISIRVYLYDVFNVYWPNTEINGKRLAGMRTFNPT